jgi:vitamin B12 transporter
MGGVVNIVTKRGDGPLAGKLWAGIGSYRAREAGLEIGASEGPLDVSLAYLQSRTGDYKTGRGETYRHTGTDNRQSGNFDIGYSFLGGLHRIGANAGYFEANDSGRPYRGVYYTLNDSRNHFAELSYAGELPERGVSWALSYSFGQDTEKWRPETDPELFTIVDFQTFQSHVAWESDFLSLTGGLDYARYETYRDFLPQRDSYTDKALFLIAKVTLLDGRLAINAGGRQNYYDLEILGHEGGKVGKKNFSFSPAFPIPPGTS